MKWRYGLVRVILSILISSIQGQVVKRDSKIRLGFGLAGFISNGVNSLIVTFEQLAREMYTETEFSPPQFKNHLFYNLEYEVDINQSFSYIITFEIHNDHINSSNVDYFDPQIKSYYISQFLDIKFNYITGGVAVAYYYPFFKTKFVEARLFTALGIDVLYTNLDIFHYYYDVTSNSPQAIDYNGTGYSVGGRGFFGFEIPFSNTIFIQVRGGFAYRMASNFLATKKANQQKPFNPSIVEKKEYNLSGFFGNLGIAFYF